jgi:hypothetical protein
VNLPKCDGGKRGFCQNNAVWKVRLVVHRDGGWSLACGQHLHWAASEETGGEQGELDLVRILTEE